MQVSIVWLSIWNISVNLYRYTAVFRKISMSINTPDRIFIENIIEFQYRLYIIFSNVHTRSPVIIMWHAQVSKSNLYNWDRHFTHIQVQNISFGKTSFNDTYFWLLIVKLSTSMSFVLTYQIYQNSLLPYWYILSDEFF